ncbi:MAG: SdpI family protein [Mucilaginibacter sp.]
MKKFNTMDIAALIIWLLPAAYLLYVYPTLPDTVPVHFGLTGTPDRYGAKSEFLIGPMVIMGMSALVYLLFKFLPSIDPKKLVKYSEPTFQKIGIGILVLMAALSIEITLSAISKSFKADKLVLPMMGLFFAFMGNLMHNIKPNYFAGIRTPWTLEDNDTWRVTHRLAGKLWFAGGIVLAIMALLLPLKAGLIAYMSALFIMIMIPVIYSYVYYKNHHQDKTAE